MSETEILEELRKVDEVFEVCHVISRFKFYRNSKAGHVQNVTVEILDAGPEGNETLRYHCMATADDKRTATGNPDSSIQDALSNMHWEHLDYPV